MRPSSTLRCLQGLSHLICLYRFYEFCSEEQFLVIVQKSERGKALTKQTSNLLITAFIYVLCVCLMSSLDKVHGIAKIQILYL